MNRFLPFIRCAVWLPLVCCALQARLTEKEDELIKRFGPVVGRGPSLTSIEGRTFPFGTDLRFKSDQWSIDALMIEGRCAEISYRKVGSWTDEQIVGLLNRNGGYATYVERKPALANLFESGNNAMAQSRFFGERIDADSPFEGAPSRHVESKSRS